MDKTHPVTIYWKIAIICSLLALLLPDLHGQEKDEAVKTIVQTGHTAPIIDFDVSSDGKYLVSTDMIRHIIIWDLKRGKQLIADLQRSGKQEGITSVNFNPRNSEQLYGGENRHASLKRELFSIYNWRNNDKVGIIANSEIAEPLHRLSNVEYRGQRDCSVGAFDTRTNDSLMQYKGYVAPLFHASINRNDSLLLVIENNPQIWDLTKMQLSRRLPYKAELLKDTSIVYINDRVSPVAKNRNFKKEELIKNPNAGDEHLKYGYKTFYEGHFFDDKIVIGGYGQYVTVWDTEANLLSSVRSEGYPIFSVDVKDNTLLAATFKGLCLGNINSPQLVLVPDSDRYKAIYCAKFIPGTDHFVSGYDRGEICMGNVNDLPDMKWLRKGFQHTIISVQPDSKSKNILAVGEWGQILQYNFKENSWLRYTDPYAQARVSSCAFINDNIIAAGSNEGFMALWNKGEKQHFKLIKAHNGEITSIIQSNDKRFIITSSNDGTVKIWNSATYEEIAKLIALENSNEYIVMTPDNYYKASQDCSHAVHFVKGRELYEYDQFDLKYNRPDIIMERMGKASPKMVELYRKAYYKRLKKMNFTEEMLSSDFHTPDLEITNARNIPAKTATRNISLNIKANDSKYRLNRLFVWLNGVPVYGVRGLSIDAAPNKELLKTLDLELIAGTNRIDVSCLNEKGAESYKQTVEISCQAATGSPDLYIVGIGVSTYKNTSYNLNYADKDAQDISNLFAGSNAGQYNNIYSKILTNEQVTRQSVTAVKDFLKTAKHNDVVILFYAGHGILDGNMDYFLAMSDMDFEKPAEKGLAFEDFEMLLDNIKPLKKMMMIDACHSGEIDKDEYLAQNTSATEPVDVVFRNVGQGIRQIEDVSVEQANELLNDLFSDIRRGVGATILSSAGGAEAAVESDKWQNGLFTYVLKEALSEKQADSNGDGVITTNELNLYAREKVFSLSQGRQKPTSRINNKQYEFTLIE
ncbi:MAG: caspase family protein [Dysgonamonadaceae bacterium]|jgi:WD40 repeat protein|nr:caspase family protein [Dysgonamonadaceae bacterium]